MRRHDVLQGVIHKSAIGLILLFAHCISPRHAIAQSTVIYSEGKYDKWSDETPYTVVTIPLSTSRKDVRVSLLAKGNVKAHTYRDEPEVQLLLHGKALQPRIRVSTVFPYERTALVDYISGSKRGILTGSPPAFGILALDALPLELSLDAPSAPTTEMELRIGGEEIVIPVETMRALWSALDTLASRWPTEDELRQRERTAALESEQAASAVEEQRRQKDEGCEGVPQGVATPSQVTQTAVLENAAEFGAALRKRLPSSARDYEHYLALQVIVEQTATASSFHIVEFEPVADQYDADNAMPKVVPIMHFQPGRIGEGTVRSCTVVKLRF